MPSEADPRRSQKFYCVACQQTFRGFWAFKRHESDCVPVVDITEPDDQADDAET